MANETAVQQTSCVQDNHEADECCENIPPGVAAAAVAAKLQAGEVVEQHSSTQTSGVNEPTFDTCTFSTPAPASSNGVKTKSRLSGLQSALTPILKYLNIGNKSPSPDPLKHGGKKSHLTPSFSSDSTTMNSKKSTEGSRQHPCSYLSGNSGRSLGDTNASMCWLTDEYLPEITLLDDTYDTTMQRTKNDSALPDSMPSTPVAAASAGKLTTSQSSCLSARQNGTTTAPISCPQNKTPNFLQSNVGCPEGESDFTDQTSSVFKSTTGTSFVMNQNSSACKDVTFDKCSFQKSSAKCEEPKAKMVDIQENIDAPLRWLDDRFFPEITLLDVTADSELSQRGEMSSLDVTQDIPSVDSLQNSMPSSATEPGSLDVIQSEDLSSTLDGNMTHSINSSNEQSDKCVGLNMPKASLEVTRDISMGSVLEDSQPSLELGGQNAEKIQTPVENSPGASSPNVTRDLSSSSDMSVQCAGSQLSASDTSCDTRNVTSELHVASSNSVEAKTEEAPASQEPQSNPKTGDSANNTFTVVEPSNLSASTNVKPTAQTPSPQNRTLDLPPPDVNSPPLEIDAKEQTALASINSSETSVVSNQSCSSVKPNSEVQNVTFDRHSLQKTTGGAGVATFNLQNDTFETRSPKQNGTITISETSSSDSHHTTLDKPPPPDVCNVSSPKDEPSEMLTHNGTTNSDPDAKMMNTPESTFEANPAVDVVPGSAQRETKNLSIDLQSSGLPVREGLSETLVHQSTDTENAKASALDLDDTLDLRADSLITSTPMTNCKMFNFHTGREEGKIIGAQKKLYGEGPSKSDAQVSSGIPSKVMWDRKTPLTQPATKSLLPPLKAASQLLKFKPPSALPGKFEPPKSGLPMTRQRTHAEALRTTCDAPHVTTGTSASYNLRPTTTGSKQPTTGLQRPRPSGMPSGIQRAAAGLKPPSAKINALPSSSTDKLRGPTASITATATKISQAKKHPLTRAEALPIAKRKKIDPAVPASTAEPSASCSAVSRVRALKQPVTSHKALLPKTQGHGCAKCVVLDQQLELKSEEIRRLKEELLKYRKTEEEC